MKIGLDAKRIFNNPTGLGVYGRNLLQGLSKIDSSNEYLLYTPSAETKFFIPEELPKNFKVVEKTHPVSYFWRTFSIVKDIRAAQLDIYHGLSNELPYNIKNSNAKNIVDIHDLCFIHFPSDYSVFDRKVFLEKTKRAAHFSDKIIATSQATKKDIVEHFKVDESKVSVVYQCCDDSFYKALSQKSLNTLKEKYQLPRKYVLCVGTIQGRKNQQAIVKAMAKLPQEDQIPILLVGNGKKYLKDLQALAKKLNVAVRVKRKIGFKDLPGIYQLATLFVYPSFVEGFGIPVLEAMASKVPVISSVNTSMAEILQNEDALVDPKKPEELAELMKRFLSADNTDQIKKNFIRSKEFSQNIFAKEILEIYNQLCPSPKK